MCRFLCNVLVGELFSMLMGFVIGYVVIGRLLVSVFSRIRLNVLVWFGKMNILVEVYILVSFGCLSMLR